MRGGEVRWADLDAPWGRRPVLLVARDEAYRLLTWVMVALLTTNIRDIPTAVRLDPRADGVSERCIVNLDSIQTIRVSWIDDLITRLRPTTIQAVDRAIHFALALRD